VPGSTKYILAGPGKKSVDSGLRSVLGGGSSLKRGGTRSVRTVVMADTLAAIDRLTQVAGPNLWSQVNTRATSIPRKEKSGLHHQVLFNV
jgi:hypothetical protein